MVSLPLLCFLSFLPFLFFFSLLRRSTRPPSPILSSVSETTQASTSGNQDFILINISDDSGHALDQDESDSKVAISNGDGYSDLETLQSDPPNNDVVLRMLDETVPSSVVPPTIVADDQYFDHNLGKNILAIAAVLSATSVSHQDSVTDDHLSFLVEFLILLICLTLIIHSLIKKPCPQTAKYQFKLLLVGFFLFISCTAMRIFPTMNPKITTIVKIWIFSGTIGIFVMNLGFVLMFKENNRPLSVN